MDDIVMICLLRILNKRTMNCNQNKLKLAAVMIIFNDYSKLETGRIIHINETFYCITIRLNASTGL